MMMNDDDEKVISISGERASDASDVPAFPFFVPRATGEWSRPHARGVQ